MNLKKFISLVTLVAVFLTLFPTSADAKSRSRSRSSSKSWGSSYKKSSWGSSKTRKTTKKTSGFWSGSSSKAKASRAKQAEIAKKRAALKAKNARKNSYGSTTARGQSKTTKVVTGNKLDQARNKKIVKQRNKKAYASYQKQKLKFKGDKARKDRKSLKLSKKQKTAYKSRYKSSNFSGSRDTYYDRRNSYYSTHYSHPPQYVYNHQSSFGMWDAMFLWMLLGNNSHGSEHIYHHQNDPGVQEWMAAAKEEAKENAELKAKLEKMEKDIEDMKSKGVKVDETYIPEDIDPDIAFNPDFVEQNSDMFYDDNKSNMDELDKMLDPSNFN